jgi:hypothetical protein
MSLGNCWSVHGVSLFQRMDWNKVRDIAQFDGVSVSLETQQQRNAIHVTSSKFLTWLLPRSFLPSSWTARIGQGDKIAKTLVSQVTIDFRHVYAAQSTTSHRPSQKIKKRKQTLGCVYWVHAAFPSWLSRISIPDCVHHLFWLRLTEVHDLWGRCRCVTGDDSFHTLIFICTCSKHICLDCPKTTPAALYPP